MSTIGSRALTGNHIFRNQDLLKAGPDLPLSFQNGDGKLTLTFTPGRKPVLQFLRRDLAAAQTKGQGCSDGDGA